MYLKCSAVKLATHNAILKFRLADKQFIIMTVDINGVKTLSVWLNLGKDTLGLNN